MTTTAYRGFTSLGPSYVYSKYLRIPIDLEDPIFLIQLFLECRKDEEVLKLSEDLLSQKPDFDLKGTCEIGLQYIFGIENAKKYAYLLDGIPENKVMSILVEENDIDPPRPPKAKTMHIVEDDFLEIDIYDNKYDYVIEYLHKIEQVITQSTGEERIALIELYNQMNDDERRNWQGAENCIEHNRNEDMEIGVKTTATSSENNEAGTSSEDLCKDGPPSMIGNFNTNIIVNQLSVQNIVVQLNQDMEGKKIQQVRDLEQVKTQGPGPSAIEIEHETLDYEPESPNYNPDEEPPGTEEPSLSEIQLAATEAESTEDVLNILRRGTRKRRVRCLYRPIHDKRIMTKIVRFLREHRLEFKNIFVVNSTGCYVPTLLFRKDTRFEKWLEKFEGWGMNPV